MIFDYTANPFGAATGLGNLFLYEIAASGGSIPPVAVALEDRIMAGFTTGTPREITIGGFN